ncbi:hypothetical protein ATZ36_03020 [Candidatus Endomicrobiellum trichonymphae]|uniref:Uncharacterized protein n=1 Tax=Endomicrobium trichonymphae TaxID=1408204 RepID=A0A1E5IM72_ENDTX|nr:hypothetical protein ATZ36_03020 [Candidatus Endomicrobium trichonymphae]
MYFTIPLDNFPKVFLLPTLLGGYVNRNFFNISGTELKSRIFIWSGKFSNNELISKIIKSSRAQVMTEFDFQNPKENILSYIPESIYMCI